MADKRVFFLVRKTFKEEVPNTAIDHALGCLTVLEFEVEPIVAFVDAGVLNCLRGQDGMGTYGIETPEDRIKMLLMSEVKVLACKEDMERYGITEDMLTDAKEFDVEETIQPVSFEEIKKGMESADMVMVF
jgi:sulfur relay (sulfurtransferase) DsrF/TusC family protein